MIRCSCNHSFAPSSETFVGPQLFADSETGAVWLYLLLFNCPACGSTRTLVMFEDVEDVENDEALEPIAAE